MLENRWIPESIKAGLFPKQVEFLCYEGREALYGGAVGGGKSVAVLSAALQYVESPGYAALILRRTYKQLSKADSILNKAKEWLLGKPGVRWNGDEHKFTFPSGATLEFGHMEHADAKHNYQGGVWYYIGVDEVTQFTGDMLAYPRTRQRRSVTSRIPIRWRGGSNPGGVGHEYVKARYVKDVNNKPVNVPGRAFFPATLADNPNIDQAEYIATLKESGIDPLTLAQLLKGDWDAVLGGRFHREWLSHFYRKQGDYVILNRGGGAEDQYFKPKEMLRFQTVDPASSSSEDADWTVISTWCLSPWGDLVWLDCVRVQLEIPDIVPLLQSQVLRWKPAYVAIEAVLSNRAVLQLAERAKNPVIPCLPIDPRGKNKLVHATPAIALAASGRVWLPADNPLFPIDDVQSELLRFTGTDADANDDIVDTLAYAADCIMDDSQGANSKQKPQVWRR